VVVSDAPQDLVRSTEKVKTHKILASKSFPMNVERRLPAGIWYGRIAGTLTFLIGVFLFIIAARDAWRMVVNPRGKG
jgi:hypothetical protein